MTRSKVFSVLAVVAYMASMAYAVWQGVANPVRNWDMVAYVGAATSWETKDKQVIYDSAMAEVKQVIWPEYYRQIVEGPLSSDKDIFYQQLPFYTVKPLYIGAIWLMHTLGGSLAQATWLISAWAFAVLAGVLLWWKPKATMRSIWLCALMAVTFAGDWPMAILARYSTPDALALMLFMLAWVSWLERGSILLFLAAAMLSMLARPDMLLMVLMVVAYATVAAPAEQRMRLPVAALSVALCMALYFGINWAMGGYSWQKLFYYTFVSKIPEIGTTEISLSWDRYIGAVSWGIDKMRENIHMQCFALFSVIAALCHYLRPVGQRHWLWFLLLAWATLAARFLLFPAWGDERYYFNFYLPMLMACLELTSPLAINVWQQLQRYRSQP